MPVSFQRRFRKPRSFEETTKLLNSTYRQTHFFNRKDRDGKATIQVYDDYFYCEFYDDNDFSVKLDWNAIPFRNQWNIYNCNVFELFDNITKSGYEFYKSSKYHEPEIDKGFLQEPKNLFT